MQRVDDTTIDQLICQLKKLDEAHLTSYCHWTSIGILYCLHALKLFQDHVTGLKQFCVEILVIEEADLTHFIHGCVEQDAWRASSLLMNILVVD